jgi:predicted TIM-barrel fold metal-dependent hydrolase
MLLFASDYPHWHDDMPEPVLPEMLAAELAKKILYDNACALYRL